MKSFNSWSFKREQPDSPESLARAVDRAVARSAPAPFVLYWGRGPRGFVAGPEIECLDFLASFTGRIEACYPPGAEITLILTDTHARLNGYEPSSTRGYFAEVATEAGARGFRTRLLGELVAAAADRIGERAQRAPLCPQLLSRLEASAAKWYRGEGGARVGAERYLSANLVEREAVEIAFPEAIFITFNGSELRDLFPSGLPVFFMYSLRRGTSIKPWFLPASASDRGEAGEDRLSADEA